MKSRKSTIMIALVALLLSTFVAVMAQQGAPQTDQKKQAEACCAMESCCCKGDSCPMKKEGAATNADAKDACCCSSGGCDMSKEGGADMAKAGNADAAKAANTDAKHACCGDSCDMMAKPDSATAGADMARTGAAKAGTAKHAGHDKKSQAEGSCCNAMHKQTKDKEVKKQ